MWSFISILLISCLAPLAQAQTRGAFLIPSGSDDSTKLTEGQTYKITWTNVSSYDILSLGLVSSRYNNGSWLISNSDAYPTSYTWTSVDATGMGFNLANSNHFYFYICKGLNFSDPFVSAEVVINAASASASSTAKSSASATSSSASSTDSTPPSQHTSSSSLSLGANIGIAIGAVAAAAAVGLAGIYRVRRQRTESRGLQNEAAFARQRDFIGAGNKQNGSGVGYMYERKSLVPTVMSGAVRTPEPGAGPEGRSTIPELA